MPVGVSKSTKSIWYSGWVLSGMLGLTALVTYGWQDCFVDFAVHKSHLKIVHCLSLSLFSYTFNMFLYAECSLIWLLCTYIQVVIDYDNTTQWICFCDLWEAQLLQRRHVTLYVVEHFAKSSMSFEITLLSRTCISSY